jgi:hypothetical protein
MISKEAKAKYDKQYNQINKEKIYEQKKIYISKNIEKVIAYRKKWGQENKEKRRIQQLNKLHNDIYAKIVHNWRSRFKSAMMHNKRGKSLDFMGCNVQFLKTYLETKFKPGMTWDNYGRDGWHIDHIIPVSSFDLSDITQVYKCFHYSNLQPLWAYENLTKSNKVGDLCV